MAKEPKKTAIENMAKRFMATADLEEKSMAILLMSAYIEGKSAGKAEERKCQEQKESVTA